MLKRYEQSKDRWPARRLFLGCIVLLLLLPTMAFADERPKNVLLLFSDDPNLPGGLLVNQAIRSSLKDKWKSPIQIYEESQDSFRIPNEKYEAELVALLKQKYEGVHLDLVFAISNPALRFLSKHRGELFPDAPVVFMVNEQKRIADLNLGSNITGVSGTIEVAPTLYLALAFHPQTERVVVIAGNTLHDRDLLALAQEEFRAYEGKAAFTYLTDLTPEEIRQQLAVLQEKTIVIFLAFNSDKTGQAYTSPEVLSRLAQTSSVPIYAVNQTNLGRGIVGGRLLSYEALGLGAAEIGLRILAGESAQNIAPQTVPSVTMVDGRQMRRWGIDEAKLPPGSIVRFKEFSVWELYKWRIAGVITLCVLQAILIVWLLISGSRRRRAEQENKRLAQVAEKERRRLDEVVSNVPGVVWESRSEPGTDERRTDFVSDYVEKMLGYSVEEWYTPGFALTLVPEDDRERLVRDTEAIFESGKSGSLQFRWKAKDGSLLWVESHLQAICDATGKTIGLRGVTMDITERKEAEEELRLSEARFRNMADSAPVMIWISGADRLCTYFNQGWLEFTGRTAEEELGSGWTAGVHEDDYISCLDIFCSSFDARQPFKMEYRLRRADGVFRWVYDTGTPRFNSTGEFLGFIGSCIDIADRKEAEDALHVALNEVSLLKNRLHEENIYLREEIKLAHKVDEIIGESNALKYVLYKIEQVAETDSSVLILGETGTGKELVARAIHQQSKRKDRPLVKVNCAALSASLIESELFGHERGAFTGAAGRKLGRFELANGATLFLDEIGELPLDLQAKLLRVIQEGEFERLGSSKTIKVDVRIIAATNRNMKAEIEKGTFREDLWYRLNVFPITVPPLRQRKEDIPTLVEHFVKGISHRLGKPITSISSVTMKKLQDYYWPGNVRELANVIERGVINAPGPVLEVVDQLEQPNVALSSSPRSLEEVEREHIINVLDDTSWRIEGPNGAARILGIHPSTLRTRMAKLGVQRGLYLAGAGKR